MLLTERLKRRMTVYSEGDTPKNKLCLFTKRMMMMILHRERVFKCKFYFFSNSTQVWENKLKDNRYGLSFQSLAHSILFRFRVRLILHYANKNSLHIKGEKVKVI